MSSPRGQFAYGRVDPREAGRAAGLRSGISRRTRALVMELAEGDVFKQITNATELWQRVLDKACEMADNGNPALLFRILQDATDRTRGRATKTQLVAVDQRVTIRPEDIEWARKVALEMREAQMREAMQGDAPPEPSDSSSGSGLL